MVKLFKKLRTAWRLVYTRAHYFCQLLTIRLRTQFPKTAKPVCANTTTNQKTATGQRFYITGKISHTNLETLIQPLCHAKHEIIPANLDPNTLRLTIPNQEETPNSGPKIPDWFIITDKNLPSHKLSRLIKCARDTGLKIGILAHTTTRKVPTSEDSRYLSALSVCDVIWVKTPTMAEQLSLYYLDKEQLAESKLPKILSAESAASPAIAEPLAATSNPTLSVCVSTYNRKQWLTLNIENFIRVSQKTNTDVELVVCDNCSDEPIDDIIKKYAGINSIRIYRNSANIGMLNNLAQTTSYANGDYIWLIGDDDIIHPDALEDILAVIRAENPTLINLNYNVNNEPAPANASYLPLYLESAQNYSLGTQSFSAKIKHVTGLNENFYTAIYSFVVKRSYAWRIYHQKTSGQPFSSLQTCVPTSKYILAEMMEEPGYWLNHPSITVNANVSWQRYIPIWLLDRLQDVYDLAIENGTPIENVNHWRDRTFKQSMHYLPALLLKPEGYQFNLKQFINRNKKLPSFQRYESTIQRCLAYAVCNPLETCDSKNTVEA
jgi:glycosyltransferase involved in cell wall biosynthesis